MDQLLVLAGIVVMGMTLFAASRWSRRRWEKEVGPSNFFEQLRSLAIFLLWCAFSWLWVVTYPMVYLVCLVVLTAGWLPVGRKRKGLMKDVVDMGFLAVIVVAPFALVYHAP